MINKQTNLLTFFPFFLSLTFSPCFSLVFLAGSLRMGEGLLLWTSRVAAGKGEDRGEGNENWVEDKVVLLAGNFRPCGFHFSLSVTNSCPANSVVGGSNSFLLSDPGSNFADNEIRFRAVAHTGIARQSYQGVRRLWRWTPARSLSRMVQACSWFAPWVTPVTSLPSVRVGQWASL